MQTASNKGEQGQISGTIAKIHLEIRRLDSESEWEGCLQSAPHKTPFHSRKWLDLVTKINNVALYPGGVYLGRDLVGVFPIVSFRRGPFRVAGSPVGFSGFSTPYLGPAVPDELLLPTLEALQRWLRQERVDYSELSLDIEMEPALWCALKYGVTPRRTVLLQLPSDSASMWGVLTKRCRGAIRKAQSSRVSVIDVKEKSFCSSFLEMSADVYRKSHRKPPLSLTFYEGLWDAWHAGGKMKALAAIRDGKLHAAAIFLLDSSSKRAYYFDGASYSQFSEFCANSLIQWSFIEHLLSEGYRLYDMLGAEHEGIRRFKLSFGGILRTYDYAYKAHSRMARLARESYRMLAPSARYIKYQVGRWLGNDNLPSPQSEQPKTLVGNDFAGGARQTDLS